VTSTTILKSIPINDPSISVIKSILNISVKIKQIIVKIIAIKTE
jgi:hypothetical protein